MNTNLHLTLLLCFGAQIGSAQFRLTTFGVPTKNDFSDKIIYTSDGHFLVAGAVDNDAALYKVDCQGQIVDSLRFDFALGGSFERFYDVVELPGQQQYLAVGEASSIDGTIHHAIALRVSSDLQQLALDSFLIFNKNAGARNIDRLNDGRWLLSGNVGGFSLDFTNVFSVTFDPQTLETLDSITEFSYGVDALYNVDVLADGNILYTGNSVFGNIFFEENVLLNVGFVRQTTPAGVLQWDHSRKASFKNKFGRMYNSNAFRNPLTGHVIVAGTSFSGDTLNPLDARYLLFSAAGDSLAELTLEIPGSQNVYQTIPFPDLAGHPFFSVGDSGNALINAVPRFPRTAAVVEFNGQLFVASDTTVHTLPYAPHSVVQLPDTRLATAGIYFNPAFATESFEAGLTTPTLDVTVVQNGTIYSVTQPLGAGFSYQWYNNGIPVAGATQPTFTAPGFGNYTVVVTDAAGCGGQTSRAGEPDWSAGLRIYPNPASQAWTLDWSSNGAAISEIILLDAMGRKLGRCTPETGREEHALQCADLPPGVYYLGIRAGQTAVWRKAVVQR